MEAMMKRRMTDRMKNEKGIALVAALSISAILLIFAIALTYRMSTYLRMLATSKEKNQTYYTAMTGVEQLRDNLRTGACQPPTWCGRIGFVGSITNPGYRDLTLAVTGVASPAQFPAAPDPGQSISLYTLLLKDNDEFDSDYTNDSDELLIAVVTSTGNSETRTSIEAGLLFDAEAVNPYKHGGKKGRESDAIAMTRRL
jgi:hypothetical protein